MSTKIAWTEETWNPVTGCSKVSPGCANCYAEAIARRFNADVFKPWLPENAEYNVQTRPERLDAPLHWRKSRRVFVNSMSDLFHEQVPDEFICDVFAVMARTPQHTYQVLTKRPERMWEFCSREAHWWGNRAGIAHRADYGKPLPNVWLGVSVENQHWADERIPVLLRTPAAVRFISAEPLLGPVDLSLWTGCKDPTCDCASWLDWVIVGGESGRVRRSFELEWARSLRDQCRDAGVAFFFKQTGALRSGTPSGDLKLDSCKEYPEAQR